MMSQPTSAVQDQGRAAYALCEAAALAARTETLLATLQQRLEAFAGDTSPLRQVPVQELQQLEALGDEVAELASQIALVLDGVPLAPLAVTGRELTDAARAALADGIVDDHRALAAARLLTAEAGFPALAEALLECDAHEFWTARVVDVLAAFRDVDEDRARAVAAAADVLPTARFCDLPAARIPGLAHALGQSGAR